MTTTVSCVAKDAAQIMPKSAHMSSYPNMKFVTCDASFTDYRPAIGPNGGIVVFERTKFQARETTLLYVIDDLTKPNPQPIISPGGPGIQTRADWCWATNIIAFNGDSLTIWTVNSDGSSPRQIDNTMRFAYPSWSSDGSILTVMNASKAADPLPSTSQIDTQGNLRYANMNGVDSLGHTLFGGMPAVNPNDSTRIAFAGQPNISSWANGENLAPDGYNQNANYIFLNVQNQGASSSNPLEPGAPVDKYDPSFQGRAPAWSPCGRYVVFESNRAGGYAIFLFDTENSGNLVQLTDPDYGAQHAKFFKSGDKLILSAFQNPGSGKGPFGVAWIDITEYVSG